MIGGFYKMRNPVGYLKHDSAIAEYRNLGIPKSRNLEISERRNLENLENVRFPDFRFREMADGVCFLRIPIFRDTVCAAQRAHPFSETPLSGGLYFLRRPLFTPSTEEEHYPNLLGTDHLGRAF